MIYNYNKFIMLNESVQEWNDKLLEYSKNCNLNGVKECIKNGADVNYKDNYGNTPLILASYNNLLQIVRYLIENGTDWNIKDNKHKDFLDYLPDENKEIIIRKYPEEYKEYLFKKDVEKYNL
jgi:ankyrin repeat protein